jgi:hypothetical protein
MGDSTIMPDITSPTLLWIKFGLFVLVGLLASALALFLFPDLRLALLMGIAIWAFARAYYFAFYVIECYIDPSFKFAGLGEFLRYALRKRRP